MSIKVNSVISENSKNILNINNNTTFNRWPPQDVINHIFSYLGDNDLRSVACTNKSFTTSVLNADHDNFGLIRTVISNFIDKIKSEQFPREREFLEQIKTTNISIKDIKSLPLV
ncbi:MAG TPA: F-box protein, partial [Chlamydiales bacterium]|nr:F-box protein [Chlamydiales bacterium]